MNRQIERLAPYFGALVLVSAIATGRVVSVGTGLLVVAGGLIVTILVLAYLAVDAVLSEGEELSLVADVRQSELVELERDKQSILTSIRDLETERDLGKISSGDFESLDGVFRKRAIDVMKKIDRDLSPWRKRAEEMVAERLALGPKPVAATVTETASPTTSPRGEADVLAPSAPSVERRACGGCATLVDADSNFCKKCGRRVTCTCGAALDADSNFCKKCGAKVDIHV